MGTAKKKLLLGGLYKFIASAISVLLGIITSVIINRYYGIEKYGLLVMVFTVTGFFSGFTNLGAKATINRVVPKMMRGGAKEEDIIKVILTGSIYLVLGVVIFGCLIYFAKGVFANYYKTDALIPLLVVGALYLAGFSIIDFLFSIYQSFQDWLKEGIFSVLYPLIYVIFILISIYLLNARIIAVLYSNIFAAILTALLGIYFLRKRLKLKYILHYDFNSLRSNSYKLFTFGFPLLFVQASVILFTWTDKFILGRYGGPKELPIYYIALNFIAGLMIFVKILFTVVMPYAAGLKSNEEIRNNYNILFKINIYFSIGVALIMFFLIDWLIKILYGPGYENVALAFKLLLPLVLIKAVLLTPSIFLQNVFEMVRTLNIGAAGIAILDILMCILLIPHYGFIGAITAILVSYLIYMYWMLWCIPKIKQLTPFTTLYRSAFFIIVLIGTYFFMIYLKYSKAIFVLPLLMTVYLIMLFITKELDFIFGNLKKAFLSLLVYRDINER